MFERLDCEELPCFLETQTPVNVAIYQKYGFTIKHHGNIPGTDIPHWAMLREPQE
jgi:predicted GNAT family N-acyltransferase